MVLTSAFFMMLLHGFFFLLTVVDLNLNGDCGTGEGGAVDGGKGHFWIHVLLQCLLELLDFPHTLVAHSWMNLKPMS